MAPLTWSDAGDKLYEYGLDRGVFYPSETNAGVAWNGLTSVDAGAENVSTEPIFFDGQKVFDLIQPGDFYGTIKAITYPDELSAFDGDEKYARGVYMSNQVPAPFGLSYRTMIGNDVDGDAHGYKIHVMYNLTAIPDNITYQTQSASFTPNEFSWKLTATPVAVERRRGTAYFTFDSTKMLPAALEALEDILYGTAVSDPRLPSVMELLAPVTITITDNGDGTWTADGPDYLITMLDADTFQITDANAIYLSADEYAITST